MAARYCLWYFIFYCRDEFIQMILTSISIEDMRLRLTNVYLYCHDAQFLKFAVLR